MKRLLIPLAALAFAPQAALAHPGVHDFGFAAGLWHPLGGADHTLAMLAVGLWAAMLGGRALWALPLGFVGAMGLGAALAMAGLSLPAVEPMILASVVLLGVAAALALRLPLGAAVAAVALFGAVHGQAHGAEAPATGAALYAIGFTLATLALHGLGLSVGLALNRLTARPVLRVLGAGVGMAGLVLAVA